MSRATADRALSLDRLPGQSRPAVATSFMPVEPLVRGLLRVMPAMPVTVIAKWIGRSESGTNMRRNVCRIRVNSLALGA